jgi:hypothetical protein
MTMSPPYPLPLLVIVSLTGLACGSSRPTMEPAGAAPGPTTDADPASEATNATLDGWKLELAAPDWALHQVHLKLHSPARRPECANIGLFTPTSVEQTLRAHRDALERQLDKPEQAALRAYVHDEFPLTVSPTLHPCLKDPVTGAPLSGVDGAKIVGVQKMFVATLARMSEPFQLVVTSKPDAAKFALSPKYADDWQSVETDGGIARLYKGKYKYTVERTGYLPVQGEVSLTSGPRVAATCRLIARPPPGVSTAGTIIVPCNFLP